MSPARGPLPAAPTAPAGTLFRATGPAAAPSPHAPPVTVGRDAARKAARDELAKRMYHKNDPGPLHRALDAVWDWVDRIFQSAAGATPGGGPGLATIGIVVLLILAALWWRLGTPSRTRPAAPPALFDETPRSAAEYRAAAETQAAQGHWKAAVQERMRATVRMLEERALLDPRPGRTADEAAAEAGHALPPYASRLGTAARAFDDVTYGGRAATRAMYDDLTVLDQEITGARPALTAPAADPPGNTERPRRGAAG